MPEHHPASPGRHSGPAGEPLRVVLVNNMPDSAMAITERRFQRLLQAACPERPVDFRCVTLPAIPRGEMAAARIARHYIGIEALQAAPPDAVLFSGAEPLSHALQDEIFWPGLVKLFDWTQAHDIPALFSCLAAHAAVLHFSGIERRRQPNKIFGVFTQTVATPHDLLRGMPARFSVPHSRWHDVAACDLVAKNYLVLTHNPATGVDMFVPADGAPQIFLQGHPEYEDGALQGEFGRDLKRFETGQSAYKPAPPTREPALVPDIAPHAGTAPDRCFGGFEAVLSQWVQQKRVMVA